MLFLMGGYPDLNREHIVHIQLFYLLNYIHLFCKIYKKSIRNVYFGVIRTPNVKYQKFMTYLLVHEIYILYNATFYYKTRLYPIPKISKLLINLFILLYIQAEGFEPTQQLSPSILSTGCIPISSCSLFYLSVY